MPHLPETRPIIVCADDFGIAPGVSDAIAELITAGRLTATSCMTGLPDWRRRAPTLQRVVLRNPADIGLHLTLTDHAPVSRASRLARQGRLPTLGHLLPRTLAGVVCRDAVADELRAQLDAFEDSWGGPPAYVDGHQHVHVLPVVREVLVNELRRRYAPNTVWVRDCVEPSGRSLRRRVALPKALFISRLALGLRRLLRDYRMPANDGFAGLHDFSGRRPFGALMRRFLDASGPRPLLHVHPGRVDATLRECDSLTAPREVELAYLASAQFPRDLAAAGLRPGRFADFTAPPAARVELPART
uniref:ChbG/HpnK family deacetylase n=1 Tax=Aromatoleum buckelii TaxID=200254 RepID=A0ABX1N709_9RHOO